MLPRTISNSCQVDRLDYVEQTRQRWNRNEPGPIKLVRRNQDETELINFANMDNLMVVKMSRDHQTG